LTCTNPGLSHLRISDITLFHGVFNPIILPYPVPTSTSDGDAIKVDRKKTSDVFTP
jgi:hypothetical protein